MVTIPTALTLARIALIPVLVFVWYLPVAWAAGAAALIFVSCSVTDWLDGWIARRFDMGSSFGRFLDPVADKLLVATALLLVVQHYATPTMGILAAIVISREIMISALREWMAGIGTAHVVRVGWLGKAKTLVQMLALTLLLYQAELIGAPTAKIGGILLLVSAVLALVSGVQYLRAAWPAFREG